MVYTFDAKFDRYKATRIYKIVSSGALARQSATRIADTLKIKGLSYRRIEMLHDIRRARTVEFSKTRETKLTSGYFFDFVYEPFRRDYGLTARQATEIFNLRKEERLETPEELELLADIEDRYHKIMELV